MLGNRWVLTRLARKLWAPQVGRFVGVKVGVTVKKTVGDTVLGALWALEWPWHTHETNLRCTGIFRSPKRLRLFRFGL